MAGFAWRRVGLSRRTSAGGTAFSVHGGAEFAWRLFWRRAVAVDASRCVRKAGALSGSGRDGAVHDAGADQPLAAAQEVRFARYGGDGISVFRGGLRRLLWRGNRHPDVGRVG